MNKLLVLTVATILMSFQSAHAEGSINDVVSACSAQMSKNAQTKLFKYVTNVFNKKTGVSETKTMKLSLDKSLPDRFKIDIYYSRSTQPAQTFEFDLANKEPQRNQSSMKYALAKGTEQCLISTPNKKCADEISQNHLSLMKLSSELLQDSDEDMATFNCVLDAVKEADRMANPQLFPEDNTGVDSGV